MKSLLSKIALLPLFITGCTNTIVQVPQQTVGTVPVAKTPTEPSKPVAVNPAIDASAPSTTAPSTNARSTTAPSTNARSTTAPIRSGSSCNYFAGKAVEGQSVNVDLCSVSGVSSGAVAFSYSLGSQKMDSEANCDSGTWTTFRDGQTHRPQSSATQKMIDRVCGDRSSSQVVSQSPTSQPRSAVVFDPPSNVRVSPSGDILCSVQQKTTINIYGSSGSWYNTDICGTMGFISKDQIRF